MKKILSSVAGKWILAALLLCHPSTPRCMAADTAGISPDLLRDLETSCVTDGTFKAVQHSLAEVDLEKVSLDFQKANSVDGHFTKRLPDEAVTEQKQSGRCWMFSALNIFRRSAAKNLNTEDFEFSQNYLFFYDKLEKANVFLDAICATRQLPYTDRKIEWLLRNPIQDAGNWLGFIELVKKYGTVPKDVMPETFSSSNSEGVNSILALRLKVAAARIRTAKDGAAVSALKVQALKDVYRILALHFGIPPKQFQWRYETKDKVLTAFKSYTPQSFYQDVLHEVLDDYLALYSIPTLPFNRHYEIDLDKAVVDRPNMHFVNVPLEQLRELALLCLQNDLPVWFGCSVYSESSKESGLMMPGLHDYGSMYGMNLTLTRKELFESYSSSPDHNMVFTGVDLRDGKPVKWLVENSWGDARGKKGFFSMTDEWFDLYVQTIVVPKKFIPPGVQALFETKAETLPPWDPMF